MHFESLWQFPFRAFALPMAPSCRCGVRTVIHIRRILDCQDQLLPLAASQRLLDMRPAYRGCLHLLIIPKARGSFGRCPIFARLRHTLGWVGGQVLHYLHQTGRARCMAQLRLSHFLLCPPFLHLFVLLPLFACVYLPSLAPVNFWVMGSL
jgi:hypothetical protein